MSAGNITTVGNSTIAGTLNVTGSATVGSLSTASAVNVYGNGALNVGGSSGTAVATISSEGKISAASIAGGTTSSTVTHVLRTSNSIICLNLLGGSESTTNTSMDHPSLKCRDIWSTGSIYASNYISASKIYHAVWNDITDAIEVQDDLDIEPGRVYCFDGENYHKSSKYAEKGIIGIHSDTAGDILGRKNRGKKELDIAIGGFVLAYVDKEYKPGTPLTCNSSGELTKARFMTRLLHSERVIATYWKNELDEMWGPRNSQIQVNGRKWVKIK